MPPGANQTVGKRVKNPQQIEKTATRIGCFEILAIRERFGFLTGGKKFTKTTVPRANNMSANSVDQNL